MREAHIQRQILDYFAATGIPALRVNSGRAWAGSGRRIKFGDQGFPDLLAWPGRGPFSVGLRSLRTRQRDHVARWLSPLEIRGPRVKQLPALSAELRAVIRRADLVAFPMREACLDHVGAGRRGLVRPGAKGGTEAVNRYFGALHPLEER